MIFTEPRFLLFFFVVFVVHWLIGTRQSPKRHRAQKVWLLICSYFFYGCWDARFLALIFTTTCVDFFVAQQISRREAVRTRKLILVVSLVANLGFLGFFKYYNFFVTSGTGILQWLGFAVRPATLNIVLPVGISFVTFQTLSYTIDVYRKHMEPSRDFLNFATFVAFFPQLVAGPIVRAYDFLPQLTTQPVLTQVQGRRWLLLFLSGFFKKACLADNIAGAIDPVFAAPSHYHALDSILASVLYSVQIYCDFSGYSDMAIATAGMLGYRLVQNFDFPYFSKNVQDFWRRWHMSLSSWLRDYLYISLGGSKGGRFRLYRNVMLTMVLGGLWHGANLTFIVWGALHGTALIVHRVFRAWVDGRASSGQGATSRSHAERFKGVASVAVTFLWVAFCFTIFRAPSMELAVELFSRMTHFEKPMKLPLDLWLLLIAVGTVHAIVFVYGKTLFARLTRASDSIFCLAYGACCAFIPYFMPVNTQPFIYFQF